MFGNSTGCRRLIRSIGRPYTASRSHEAGDRFYDDLLKLTDEDWVKIDLGPSGDVEVEVYGGLFVAPFPQPVFLQHLAVVPKLSIALSAAFDMDTWPDATEEEIKGAISGLPDVEFLAAYDVGQGAANALLDGSETAVLYFDLGCGVYGNKHTTPTPLRFCWRATSATAIVLSHWDSDHWAGEVGDPNAYARIWLAPRQKISIKHATFASKILGAGGAMLIWGSVPTHLSVPLGARHMRLARCNGPPSSRNDSGISCLIEDTTLPEAWLLTGDAGYHKLNQTVSGSHNRHRRSASRRDDADKEFAALPSDRLRSRALLVGAGNKHGKDEGAASDGGRRARPHVAGVGPRHLVAGLAWQRCRRRRRPSDGATSRHSSRWRHRRLGDGTCRSLQERAVRRAAWLKSVCTGKLTQS